MLNGRVQEAPSGAIGCDTDTVLTAESAKALNATGRLFVARYLSLVEGERPGDLTQAEAQTILDAGLCLFPVQHVNGPGWAPTAALGDAHGTAAAVDAAGVGFPSGVCVALDLEGAEAGAAAADVIAYCNSWANQVRAANYLPLLYVGAQCGLSGFQLYHELSFTRYWKSESAVPALPARGYCMIQFPLEAAVAGVSIDRDEAQNDGLGGAVVWLAPV
jgi:Domain of unknown function (DUF1906)